MLTSNLRQSVRRLPRQPHHRTHKLVKKLLRNVSKKHPQPMSRLRLIKARQCKVPTSSQRQNVKRQQKRLQVKTR